MGETGNPRETIILTALYASRAASLLLMNPNVAMNKLKNIKYRMTKLKAYKTCNSLPDMTYRVIDEFDKSDHDDILIEYTRLFISSFPKTPCPPYESVYRGNRSLMHLEIVNSLTEIYDYVGLEINKDYVDLPEHVAAELELLSYILDRILVNDNYELHTRLLKKLVKKHLSRWIPEFSRCIKSASKHKAYRELSELMSKLLWCLENEVLYIV